VLENFLSDFQGCLLIVSHDRYFMDRLVEHLFVFEGQGEVRDFPGNYSDYRIWQRMQEKQAAAEKMQEKETNAQAAQADTAGGSKAKKKWSFNEKREFEQLEKDIPALEKEKAEITVKMGDGALAYEDLQKLSNRIMEITSLLEEKEMRWLELSEIGQ
jgi:ATP-binding cassette subfamily F protein uup